MCDFFFFFKNNGNMFEQKWKRTVVSLVKTNYNKPDGLLTDTVKTLHELHIIIGV